MWLRRDVRWSSTFILIAVLGLSLVVYFQPYYKTDPSVDVNYKHTTLIVKPVKGKQIQDWAKTSQEILNGQPDKTSNRDVTGLQSPSYADDVTVVTAYFFIPKFLKGGGNNYFSNTTYINWAKVFIHLVNPLVVYTDSDVFYDMMSTLRKDRANITRLIKVDRKSFWSFQRISTIGEIFSQQGYPIHHPNTVVPAYSCAQHAKVEVMRRAVDDNTFRTNYFAWIDVGCFRASVKNTIPFTIIKPPDFDNNKIAMSEVFDVNMNVTPTNIFRGNQVWVGGAVVLGHRKVLPVYEQQYKRAFEYFLSQKLMNTDQQLLYAMFSREGRKAVKPEVELQVYKGS